VIDGESKFPVIDYAKLTFMHLSEFLAHVKFFVLHSVYTTKICQQDTLRYDTIDDFNVGSKA